ncbi:MAG: hypothetical protein JNM43_18265 [Planctomycetaceae bacterium]|nr:hypothetical protein [Planctomycetaceae bacterium]
MKRRRFSCPGCSSVIEVSVSTETTTIECPQCRKRLRIAAKPAPPKPSQPEPTIDAANHGVADSTGESEEGDEESSWSTHDDSSWNEESYDSWSHEETEEPDEPSTALPPRSPGRKNQKPAKDNNAEPAPLLSATEKRRSLDDLTEGTFQKKHLTSETGSRVIKGMLLSIGTMVFLGVIFGFVRSQLRSQGFWPKGDSELPPGAPSAARRLDTMMDVFDHFAGNGEQPVTPSAPMSGAELAKNLSSLIRITPVDTSASKTIPNSEWHLAAVQQTPAWKLEVDKGASFAEIAALSAKYRLGFARDSNQLVFLSIPGTVGESVVINLESKRGRRLVGTPGPRSISIANRNQTAFLNTVKSYSPDGDLVARQMVNSDSSQTQSFITVHEFDNTLLKVIKDGTAAQFVSNRRLLISKQQGNKVPRKDGRTAQTISFLDLTSDESSEEITIPLGGHWALSPTFRYLLIFQPDIKTVAAIEAKPDEPYQFQCENVVVRIYDTTNAKELVSTELNDSTVGELAVVSHDGTRIAVYGGGHILVLNMENGTRLASGKLVGAAHDRITRNHNPFRWLGGSDYLQAGSVVVSVKDGNVVFADKSAEKELRLPGRILADIYGRDGEGAYTQFSMDALNRILESASPPNATETGRPESMTLNLTGTDSEFIREMLRTLIPQRLKFTEATEATDTWRVDIDYSEFPGGSDHNLDQWRDIDPFKRKLQRKEQANLPESQPSIGVQLKLTCTDNNGKLVCEEQVRGVMAPNELKFDLPIEAQFQTASIAAAINTLKPLSPPIQVSTVEIPPDTVWAGSKASEQVNPLGGEFEIEVLPVDNLWFNDPHGIPLLEPADR